MQRIFQHRMSEWKNQVNSRGQRLQNLSPLNVLKRGYTICRRASDEKIVRGFDEISTNESVELIFYRGGARAEIQEIADKNLLENSRDKLAE
jgi:exodeoxyribonuclease VII large subunit